MEAKEVRRPKEREFTVTEEDVRMIRLPTQKHKPRFDRPLSILVVGPPKAGKTTFVGTFPDVLVIDFDAGAEFLSDIYLWRPRSLQEVREALSEPLPPMYKAIALDSLTSLAHMIETEVVEKAGVESLGDIPFGRGYTDVRRQMSEIIRMAQAQGRWVVATAHLYLVSESPVWTPEMSGRLRTIVSALFDCIAYLRVNEDGTRELVFSQFDASHPEVGSRHPALAGKIIPATFEDLIRALRGWRPKSQRKNEHQMELMGEE